MRWLISSSILDEESQTGEHEQVFMLRTVSMIIVFVEQLVTSQIVELVQRRHGKGNSLSKVDIEL